jgi:cytochrome c oxidase subunit 2
MDERQHHAIARWERRWLAISGLMSLSFVILIAYSLVTEGSAIAQSGGRADPTTLTTSALFAEPGVRTMGPGEFQVTLVAQAFAFDPETIVLPVGAKAHFYMTSRDVIHGYGVENTYINIEIIPGEIATFEYTFDRAGRYRVSCNEYCGISHQNMLGAIEVLPAAEYSRRVGSTAQTVPPPSGQAAQAAGADGASVFQTNCVSCHQANGQGIAGAFPPLAGHAPDLFAADRSYPVKVLLHGLQGEIRVAGAVYNGQMPAWNTLSDEELAAVANYVMTNWGNDGAMPADAAPYTPEDFADARGETMTPDEVHALRGTLGLP